MSDPIPAQDPTIAEPGFAAAQADADAARGQDVPGDTARIEEIDVEHVVERLTERFSDLPPEVVEETVTEIHESFDDAAVRDFVPRIVEHDASDKLREVEAEAHAAPDDTEA